MNQKPKDKPKEKPKIELVGFLQPRTFGNVPMARQDFIVVNLLEDNIRRSSYDYSPTWNKAFNVEFDRIFHRFYQGHALDLVDIVNGTNELAYNPRALFFRHYSDSHAAVMRLAKCQNFSDSASTVQIPKTVHRFSNSEKFEHNLREELHSMVYDYIEKLKRELYRAQSSTMLCSREIGEYQSQAANDPESVEFIAEEGLLSVSKYTDHHRDVGLKIEWLQDTLLNLIDKTYPHDAIDDVNDDDAEKPDPMLILSVIQHKQSTEQVNVKVDRLLFEFATFNISIYDRPTTRYINGHMAGISKAFQIRKQIDGWKSGGVPDEERTYKVQGEHEPMFHQHVMAKLHSSIPFSANLSAMGTGKTYGVLMAIDELIEIGEIKRKNDGILVVCPNTVMPNWEKEIRKHAPHLTSLIVKGSFIERAQTLMSGEGGVDILITNYESFSMYFAYNKNGNTGKNGKAKSRKNADMKITMEKMLKNRIFDLVVLDECHRIKNPGAKRTRNIIAALGTARRKIIMTGTINANTAADIYIPFYFLTKGSQFSCQLNHANENVKYAMSGLREQFKDMYLTSGYGRKFKSPAYMNEVTDMMSEISVQFKKADCLDLPPKVYRTIEVEMVGKHRELYELMEKQLMIDLREMADKDGFLRPSAGLGKLTKLREAVNGWLYDNNGKPINFPVNPKLKALIEETSNINLQTSKIVVWSTFRNDMHILTKQLRKLYGHSAVACIHGGTWCRECGSDVNTRYDTTQNFNNMDDPLKIIVVNSMAGSHGIDLTGADYEIFFSNSYIKTDRSQAEDRCHRKGMRESLTIVDIVTKDSIDEDIMAALAGHKAVTHAMMERLGRKEGLIWHAKKGMFVSTMYAGT